MMFDLLMTPIEETPQYQSAMRTHDDPQCGGIVSFAGRVRNHNHGQSVLFLEYEAYDVLAKKEAENILQEIHQKFPIKKILCLHRVGRLEIGDMAVWIQVTAEHRKPAFAATEYMIDELKKRVPIWKNEHYGNGESSWVQCHHR